MPEFKYINRGRGTVLLHNGRQYFRKKIYKSGGHWWRCCNNLTKMKCSGSISINATMQKCHDIRNLDTCDFYRATVLVENGCSNSSQEDLYSMFFHYVVPELACPLKSGLYHIVEYPFLTEDSNLMAAESKISTSLFGYTFRVEVFQEDERILCADAYIRHQYIREHEWNTTRTPSVAGNNITEAASND